MKAIKAILEWFLGKLFTLEHWIYCTSDCKIELPLHRKYYAFRKKMYINHLKRNHPEWC